MSELTNNDKGHDKKDETKKPTTRRRAKPEPVVREAKARERAEKRLAGLQGALAGDWFGLHGHTIVLHTGRRVHLPPDLIALVDGYVGGTGLRAAVVSELRDFAHCIRGRLYNYVDEFEDPEDPLLKLVEEQDEPPSAT